MTKRLEKGERLSDLEVPFFVMLLHAYNSRDLLNYEEAFIAVRDQVAKIEAYLRTQQTIRQSVDTSRRIPQPNVGPPNQSPFPSG